MLRAELLVIRTENRRIRELYEACVKNLEQERNQISQTLAMMKYRVIQQIESVFEAEMTS